MDALRDLVFGASTTTTTTTYSSVDTTEATKSSRRADDDVSPVDKDDVEQQHAPPQRQLIGWFGSLALVVNNVSGPGLLDFPAAYRQAGWLPATAAIFVVACASAFVAAALVDATSIVAHGKRLEFSAIFGKIFGRRTYVATQALYLSNLFSQNVAAIVSTAQATDALLATVFGSSVALDFAGHKVVSWSATSSVTPFSGDDSSLLLLTLGYALCFVTLFPLGCLDLEDNMLAQKASFLALVALCAFFIFHEWLPLATARRLDDAHLLVPVVGPRFRDLVGVCLFNFAFCVTVPPWHNEKDPRVNATAVIWTSCLASAVGYALVGFCGASAYARASDNVLDDLTAPTASFGARVGGGLFAWAIIGLGVPVFSVLMRMNLLGSFDAANNESSFTAKHDDTLSTRRQRRVAMFVGAVLPWLVSWPLYHGHGVLGLLSWSGLILDSAVDFLLPIAAALAVSSLVVHTTHDNRLSAASADTRPLPRGLMPYYAPIKRFVLLFVTTLVLTGLGLQLRYVFSSYYYS